MEERDRFKSFNIVKNEINAFYERISINNRIGPKKVEEYGINLNKNIYFCIRENKLNTNYYKTLYHATGEYR